MADAAPPAACPFCGSVDTEVIGAWATTMLTRQQRCRACGAYFERVRLGHEPSAGAPAAVERVWDALREVRDPEWPVSIVDLGLVRDVEVRDGRASVRLAPTSTACPCLDWIRTDVRARLLAEPGIRDVRVEIVWDPWTPARMSEAARAAFRRWGTAP